MHTNLGVNRPRLSGDRWPRRSQWNMLRLLHAFVLALLVSAGFVPRSVLAQASSQQSAEQPASPDTAQTKINQPPVATPVAAPAGAPATVVLTPIRDEQGVMAAAVPAGWNQVAQGDGGLPGHRPGAFCRLRPNQGNFATNWGTPGIALYYSSSLPAAMEPEDLLAVFDYAGTCQDGGPRHAGARAAQRDVPESGRTAAGRARRQRCWSLRRRRTTTMPWWRCTWRVSTTCGRWDQSCAACSLVPVRSPERHLSARRWGRRAAAVPWRRCPHPRQLPAHGGADASAGPGVGDGGY